MNVSSLRYLLFWPLKAILRDQVNQIPGPIRTVHVDVTRVSLGDEGTGIHRVTRQLARHLYELKSRPFRLSFVVVTPLGRIAHASDWIRENIRGYQPEVDGDRPVFSRGDVYLFLDTTLPPRGLPRKRINRLHEEGVKVATVVHDILPISHPRFFRLSSRLIFRWWMRMMRASDLVITVSMASAREIKQYLRRSNPPRRHAPEVKVIPLSGEPENQQNKQAESRLSAQPRVTEQVFMSVGTVEPRKGYDELIDAFDVLWAAGSHSQLWIFGKEGWKVKGLSRRIRRHGEFGDKLKWSENSSDLEIRASMRTARALLANSFAEGYGLPLAEALWEGLPVIARDIPVFREFNGQGEVVTLASNGGTGELVRTLLNWSKAGSPQAAIHSKRTWRDATLELMAVLDSLGD